MNSKHSKITLSLIRNILLIVIIIFLTIIVITIFYEDIDTEISYDKPNSNRYYTKEKSNNSNLEVLVSNQSFENPLVHLTCYINGVEMFDEEFEVGDQHVVSYYFENIIEGEHILIVTSEDGHEEEYKFQTGPTKKYFYITYWKTEETEHISILESDDFIGID